MQQKEPPKPKQETRQALPGKSFFEDLEKPNNPEKVKKLEAAIGSYYDRMRDETKSERPWRRATPKMSLHLPSNA